MAKRTRSYKRRKRSALPGLLLIILALAAAVLALAVALLGDYTPDSSGASSTPTTTTTTTAPAVAGFYVTTDALNMRSGPGTTYEVLGVLPVGKVVEVLGTENGWYRISLMGETAYIHPDYVTPSSATTATTTTTTTTTKKPGTTVSPQYNDRYIDENGMLQFAAGDRYVQAKSYQNAADIPWALRLVNDWNPMPKGYDEGVTMVASGHQKVDKRILADLNAMLEAGKAYNIGVQSGYRPASKQDELYWRQVRAQRNTHSDEVVAQTKAGEVVKRPGFSEHNTGLAVDLYGSGDYSLTETFANTPAYQWLIENCADYGFILRFPKGKEAITGVIYEAWHFRYVGDPAIAHAIMDGGLCLEEYLEQNSR